MKFSLFAALFLSTIVSVSQEIIIKTIYFENADYTISDDDTSILKEVFDLCTSDRFVAMEIYGFTDTSASIQYNMRLSKRRAESTYNYLQKTFKISAVLSQNQVNVQWFGEAVPDVRMIKLNYHSRAVDIVIKLKVDDNIIELPEEKIEPVPDISELYKLLLPEPQNFCIDPSRDTVIIGERGTQIFIRANSFELSGIFCKPQCIEITLREVFDKSDIILLNLSTMSNGSLLESTFMMEIRAFACEKELSLEMNSQLQVFTPVTGPVMNGILFYGERDMHNNMNWLPDYNSPIDTQKGLIPNILNQGNGGSDNDDDPCPFFFCRLRNFFNGNSGAPGNGGNGGIDDHKRKEKIQNIEEQLQDSTADYSTVQYYVFNVSKLGWLNNDKFLTLPPDKRTDLIVIGETGENIEVKIVFKNYKSVYANPPVIGDNYTFARVAIDEPVWIVGLKYIDSQIYLAMKETKIKKNQVEEIEFVKVDSVKELKKLLERMN